MELAQIRREHIQAPDPGSQLAEGGACSCGGYRHAAGRSPARSPCWISCRHDNSSNACQGSKKLSYVDSARRRALSTSLQVSVHANAHQQLHASQQLLATEVLELQKQQCDMLQQIKVARQGADAVLGDICGAGVDMNKWRCELRDAFPCTPSRSSSSSSSPSSSSSSPHSSSSSASSSCASPASSFPSSPASTSAASSPSCSPPVSRGTSSKQLLSLQLEADRLRQDLQAAKVTLAATRAATAALAEQLPVIQALSDPQQPAMTAVQQPATSGVTAALRNVALGVALAGQPPVPLPALHPDLAYPGARLLKCNTRPGGAHRGQVKGQEQEEEEETCPGTPSVWLLHAGGQAYVAKVEPCHSAAAEAELAAGRLQWSSTDKLAPLRRVAAAAVEAANAARINDACTTAGSGGAAPVLSPLAVFVRECSLRDTHLCVGHDKEVVILYRYCPSGDAYEWAALAAEGAARQAGSGSRRLRAAAAAVAARLQRIAADMVWAVADVHRAGWVLGDHKPENMVRCPESGRWVLIDTAAAASVRGSADGWLAGCGTHTPIYAAPEQRRRRHARRGQPSDVFTVGVSVEELVDRAARRFGAAAGQEWLAAKGPQGCSRRAVRSAEWRAESAVRAAARRLGLMKLAWRCTREEPAERPSMGEVCRLVGV